MRPLLLAPLLFAPLLDGCLALSIPPTSTTHFKSVAAGDASACGLYADGYARCWSKEDVHPEPRSHEKFAQLDGGNSGGYCGVTEEGKISCFGENVNESPLAGKYAYVALGGDGGCAIKLDGSLACWGALTGPPDGTFGAVSVGKDAACAISDDGVLSCWGGGSAIVDNVPESVAIDVSVGGHDACLLDEDGRPVCWGDGENPDVEAAPNLHLISVSVGTEFACGLSEAGVAPGYKNEDDSAASCWGSITDDDVSSSAVWTDLSAGTDLVCLANSDEGVCYGNVATDRNFW